MIEIPRAEFKSDPVFKNIWRHIMSVHKVAKHTEKVLFKNRRIKDFCEEARHFLIIENDKHEKLFIHYDVSTWWKDPAGVQLRIDSIAFYDSFLEFEAAKNRSLHGSKDADIPNIN